MTAVFETVLFKLTNLKILQHYNHKSMAKLVIFIKNYRKLEEQKDYTGKYRKYRNTETSVRTYVFSFICLSFISAQCTCTEL